jgi:DNA/RNA endonuclease YhcR with UshA esterase domain
MLIAAVLLTAALQGQTFTTAEAKSHIGQEATVCGTVKSARYAETSNGKPTFLNLDKPYPNPTFTVVIFETDRRKFDQPEIKYRDKEICVTGKITEFRGAPETVVKDPKQITESKR